MEEFLFGTAILVGYFIVCALSALALRLLFKIPDEVFRKTLHFILLGSSFVLVYAFETWWISALACLLIILIAYPILFFLERIESFSETLTERKKGELKNSLIVVFMMFAVVFAITWGLLNDKVLALISIFSWGFGDAFAALIGTNFGKTKIYKKKSLEGTLAMLITAFVVVLVSLLIHNIIPWYGSLISAILVSIVAAIIELYTPDGYDTITCPFGSMAMLLLCLLIFGGL